MLIRDVRIFAVLIVTLSLALSSAPAWAAPDITITDATTAASPATYTAGPFLVPNDPTPLDQYPHCGGPNGPCDDTRLTVNVAPGEAETRQIVVSLSWPLAMGEFDLFVYNAYPPADRTKAAGRSISTVNPNVVFLPAVSGTYTITILPYDPRAQSPTVSAWIADLPTAPPALPGPAARFQIYPAPAGLGLKAGEPSIGINWATDVVATQAATDTLFTTFDDCSSPAADSWVSRFPLTSYTPIDLDPILFTDPRTGRTFVSLLLADFVLFTTGSSASSHTDDDGASWTANYGSSIPGAVDHQTVGGGPFHAPQVAPTVGYPDAVYYCAHGIASLLDPALCALSLDGGETFGPAVDAFNNQCQSMSGHLKVAPDGTVYLPSTSCPPLQGLAVSTDNGTTWTVRTVPGSQSRSGLGDPSVAIGQNDVGKPPGQPSNTIYFGFVHGDGHAKIAVSHDQGLTWGNLYDVGALAGIRNAQFPEVVAGDDDRAAFFFLGTTTGGNDQDPSFTGVWYPYVAVTYDGGRTWGLTNASPADPVQIGPVCLSGNLCAGHRNLADFNDVAIDREGRPVFVFADGCLAPGCAAASPVSASNSSVEAIGRWSGGKTLFSAYDAGLGSRILPAPPRILSATKASGQVTVRWMAPDDGGSPLTGYSVYRGASRAEATLVAMLPPGSAQFIDADPDPSDTRNFYQVTALNARGESDRCREAGVVVAPESACAAPGLTVLTDPIGPELDSVPPQYATPEDLDVLGLRVSEAFTTPADKAITFAIRVASLSSLAPGSTWRVSWTQKDDAGTSRSLYVEANTLGTSAFNPRGDYGFIGGGSGGAHSQCPAAAGCPATVVFDFATNLIRIRFDTSVSHAYTDGAGSTFNARVGAGTVLSELKVTTFTTSGASADATASGAYTARSNRLCAPVPAARLAATTPVAGSAPLAVDFSGAASSGLAGEALTYIFDFGDGTPAVTQAGAAIAHTYDRPGTYTARLTVTDAAGVASFDTSGSHVAVSVAAPPPGSFFSLSPCRQVDSRSHLGLDTPLLSGAATAVALTGGACAVPASAVAVSMNLTVLAPSASGAIVAYPAAGPAPGTNTISFAAGKARANNAVLMLGTGGTLQLLLQSGGQADVIIDVNGWFE